MQIDFKLRKRHYRIDSDTHQYILRERSYDKDGAEVFLPIGYYSDLFALANKCVTMGIKDAGKILDIKADIMKAVARIEAAIGPRDSR